MIIELVIAIIFTVFSFLQGKLNYVFDFNHKFACVELWYTNDDGNLAVKVCVTLFFCRKFLRFDTGDFY